MAWKQSGHPAVQKQRDKWVVRVDGIDTESGRRRPRQVGTYPSRRSAQAAASAFTAAGEVAAERETVGHLVEQWVAGKVDVSNKTRLQYEWAAGHIRAGIGGVRIGRLELDMIPHHAQAIEMAEIALDPAAAAGPDVLDLAIRVRDTQDPEIELMRTWLDRWGMPITDEEMEAMGGMDGMDHSGMEGMMTEAVKVKGVNDDALDLADEIIAAQQQEIDEMRDLLDG